MAGHDRRPVRPVRKNCGCTRNGPPKNSNARKAYKIARNEGDSGVPEERIDVLCQCGWGRLKCPLSQVPQYCPMCQVDLRELLGDPADLLADDDASEYVPPPVAYDDDEIVDDDDMNRNGPKARRRRRNPPLKTLQDIQKAWKELIDEGTPPMVAKQIILRELQPPKTYEKDQAGSDRRQSQMREWLDRQSAESRGREEKGKEKIAARNGRSSGRRPVSTKRSKMRRNSLDVLRDVNVDGYRLLTWDPHRMRNGKDQIGYRFMDPSGKTLFEGEDFGNSPLHAVDSDQTLRSLLTFITLRPGDTDREWFDGYTPEQLEFAHGDAERLSLYAQEDGPELVNLDDFEGDDSDA